MSGNGSSAPTGAVMRREFGAEQIQRSGETATSSAAAIATARVQAMYVMALQRPRDMTAVRERLLTDCRRRRFAESARYSLPRGGKKISGPSVRFAEAASRAMTNLDVSTQITYDDPERRVGEVVVTDIENNVTLRAGFTLDKTVERKKVDAKDTVLGERTNSSGETVYRILATEADVLMKQEALIARLRRNLILQILPGDLRDEALEECTKTLRSGDAADPSAAAKRLVDAFAGLGIGVSHLQQYLGHSVDKVTPDEADDLRGVYSAINEGETTWQQIMELRRSEAPMGDEEKQTRQSMLRRLAELRVTDRAAYDAAFDRAGVVKTARAGELPTEVLEKVVAGLDAKAEGGEAKQATPEPEREPGSDDDQPPLPTDDNR